MIPAGHSAGRIVAFGPHRKGRETQRHGGEGGPSDRHSIRLATRRNGWIANVVRQEARPESLRASVTLFREHHPEARLRSATARYNCMALPFGSRRTWIAPDALDPVLSLILRDGEYRQIEAVAARPGDLVVYRATMVDRSVSHIAVVDEVGADVATADLRLFVLSKWGQYGEYRHRAEDVPVWLGVPTEYWTDRREA